MERRGFLKSLIGGITSAGVIVKATPAEVRAFGAIPDLPVVLSPQHIAPPEQEIPAGFVRPGETLYDAAGRAVGIVDAVRVEPPDIVEVTQFCDSNRRYMPSPGPRGARIFATALWSVIL